MIEHKDFPKIKSLFDLVVGTTPETMWHTITERETIQVAKYGLELLDYIDHERTAFLKSISELMSQRDELRVCLSKYAKEDNWDYETAYGPHGKYTVYSWKELDDCPWSNAQEMLDRYLE